MCKHGDTRNVLVRIPANLSSSGYAKLRYKPIDKCIAPIVEALNKGAVFTRSSCCGHGKREGHILLQDGRALLLLSKEQTKTYLENKTQESSINEWLYRSVQEQSASFEGRARQFFDDWELNGDLLDDFIAWLDAHTEKEDEVGEIEFTPEEAEARKDEYDTFITEELHGGVHVNPLRREYFSWLDAHTERELTYPCPGCGESLVNIRSKVWKCGNNFCPITYIEVRRNVTPRIFSEALNRGE